MKGWFERHRQEERIRPVRHVAKRRRLVRRILIGIAITLIVIGLIAGPAFWWFDNLNTSIKFLRWDFWRVGFAPNGMFQPWGASPLGFMAMAVLFGALLFVERTRTFITKILFGLVAVSVIMVVVSMFVNIGAKSASYSAETTFVVKTGEEPVSLRWLFNSTNATEDDCIRRGDNLGVQSCIAETDEFPLEFEPRVASATGAAIVLRRATGSDNLSRFLEETLAYMPKQGVWTGIRDGALRQPITGVVEWDGTTKAQTCRFDGEYDLNYAFSGKAGGNLHNEVTQNYPNNLYDRSDMYGYCDGDEPVIVIPTVNRDGFKFRTTDRFAGLIVIKGSSSGEPQFNLVTEIEPGDIPGPVYPASLAARQRGSIDYAAGFWNKYVRSFGYDTSGIASQLGNPSEYLLKSSVDGRTYWVTPERPSGSDGEQLVSYSVVAADEATQNELNQHNVYVLDADDAQVVDLQRLYNRVTDAVNQRQPAFFTGTESSGNLTEFLPIGKDTWQVYAERSGEVVYLVEININDRIAPKVTNLTATANEDGDTTDTPTSDTRTDTAVDDCSDTESLSVEQIEGCIANLVGELSSRSTTQ